MRLKSTRRLAVVAAAVATAVVASSCSGGTPDEDVVALLLPDDRTARWEQVDRPAFEAAVAEQCPECEVLVYNAQTDVDKQSAQVGQAEEAGADVIVLAAVSSESGEQIVADAGETPVIAYDRFVAGADYHVSFDAAKVGQMQATALVEASPRRPRVLMINGADGDPNAVAMQSSAEQVLTDARARVLAEVTPADWHPDTARKWVARQLRRLGDTPIDAVYAGNDAQAGGVVAAFRAADRRVPVLTGQDGELPAIQRLVEGTQTMTVYKSTHEEAAAAAEIAVALIRGEKVSDTSDVEGVPSRIFDPVAVDVETLTNTVVRDGVYGLGEICTKDLRRRCEALGLV